MYISKTIPMIVFNFQLCFLIIWNKNGTFQQHHNIRLGMEDARPFNITLYLEVLQGYIHWWRETKMYGRVPIADTTGLCILFQLHNVFTQKAENVAICI
jgi:hypothetical protein